MSEIQMPLFTTRTIAEVDPGAHKWSAPTPPSLAPYKQIWMDTETDGTNPYRSKPVGISGYTEDGKCWYLPFLHAGGGNIDEPVVKRWARKELVNKDITFLSGKFDASMFWNWGIDLEAQGCQVHDVAYGAALLDERRKRFNLEQLSQDILGMGKDTSIRVKGAIAEMPASMVGPYAEQDARLVYLLDQAIRYGTNSRLPNSIQSDKLEKVLNLEDAIIFAVCEMERNGCRIDRAKAEIWNKELKEKHGNLLMEIYQKTGLAVNPDSGPEMSRLFRYLGLEAPRTAKGAESFEGEYLATIKNEIVQKALKARRYASLRSKYVSKILNALDENNIVRYVLHQLRSNEEGYGTISGRFSSAAPKTGGINIQQVTKPDKQIKKFGPGYIIRELFIPDTGKVWLSADASQIEFRFFAHYSGSQKLIQAYQENPWIDFHQLVTDMIQKIKPDFIRSLAKNVNFAKVYGAGRDKIADQLGLSREESDKFVDAYEEEFPEVAQLLRQATRLAENRGFVRTMLGRLARFIKPSSQDPQARRMEEINYKPHSALNRVLQGTAADFMKWKLWEVYKIRKEIGLLMRATIHDEIVGDLEDTSKVKRIEEVLNDQTTFEKYAERTIKVPILWNAEIAANWAMGKA